MQGPIRKRSADEMVELICTKVDHALYESEEVIYLLLQVLLAACFIPDGMDLLDLHGLLAWTRLHATISDLCYVKQ